jgi:hypothetical protein
LNEYKKEKENERREWKNNRGTQKKEKRREEMINTLADRIYRKYEAKRNIEDVEVKAERLFIYALCLICIVAFATGCAIARVI